ncbi:MAG: phosphoribosylaminoimidazole carboxylase / phosphoribosylaminoimidazole-succinocarboxamide synthase [Alphaproteobacteria bacterium]|jgi:phosphoribosylaminoimidazole carboxylase/phosphoribosylaminoimidazole-succinocarboxamide synthase|nr:phosphoribosylaminoimidazole carboxylase / phosphoribosylaminoimidazole-succinocarboxamide synthase [Alphaproteobacteria bacterium]
MEPTVDAKMSERLATKHPLGALVTEGKTKKIHSIKNDPDLVTVLSKDDITAGDGAKHDIIPDKGRLATATTANVFRLLKACGLPVAFVEQDSPTSFIAPKCEMLPYEVVVRREAHGSYLKRNPHFAKGQLFPQLIVEFFLKTKDKNWKGKPLVCDDPLLIYAKDAAQIQLFNPAKPLHGQEPFLVLPQSEVFGSDEEWKIFPDMRRIARDAFLVLEKAWQLEGGTLVDFKVEFGFDTKGSLLLADVIDNDSWRVIESGSYIDKQVYRDGGALDDVAAKYRRVAEITSRFHVPRQRIILWRGSEKDNPDAFAQALGNQADLMTVVTCSVHKEPVAAAGIFHRMLQEVPDSVVIAYIGRSNGAGPTLSAMSTVPVITVPASIKEFPDDIWSSLRAPSTVPVMTVLEPANAVLAALQILSARNPRLYAHIRGQIENRTINTIQL